MSVRPLLRTVLSETWPVVVIVFAGLLALGHIATTDWMGVFFYNADSLVLPLVEESFQRGEAFEWVFSSQMFLFPEGALYVLSTLLTDNPRLALSINAVLNLVALYAMLRVTAHLLARHSRHRFVEIGIALGATLLFVIFSLLEPVASPNVSGIATPFLFNTYYAGAVLAGFAVLNLTLWVFDAFSSQTVPRRRVMIYAAAVVLIGGLTTFSNPLFLFILVAPLWITIIALVFMNRMSWRSAALPLGTTLVASVLAMALRELFPQLFATSVGRYFVLSHIPQAIKNIYLTFAETVSSPEGVLKLLIIGAILVLDLVLVIYALYAQARPALAARISTDEVFVVGFVAVSAISLVVGQVLTGSLTNRYLQPVFLFPLLTVVLVGVYALRRMLVEVERAELRRSLSRFAIGLAAVASAVVVVTGAFAVPTVAAVVHPASDQGDCVEDFVGDSGANGVASFWVARPLQLYGDQPGQVLQVTADLEVYPWMINLASYRDLEFSFVVFDATNDLSTDTVVDDLGEPVDIVVCGAYTFYDYAGTAGEDLLTERIADSLERGAAQR